MKCSHCDQCGMMSLSKTAIVRRTVIRLVFYAFVIPSAFIKKPRFIHRLIARTDQINDGDTISLDTIPLKA
jgi:hypothetical protein